MFHYHLSVVVCVYIRWLLSILVLCLLSALNLDMASAAIIVTGNVTPPQPWNSSTSDFRIGDTTDGTLTVNSRSDLYSYYGYIGYEIGASGLASVTGTSSTWTNGNTLSVGYKGNGTLNISDGAVVTANSTYYIGSHTGSTGIVTVAGLDSRCHTDSNLLVGCSGNGTLNIFDDSNVTVNDTTYIAHQVGSTGTINFGDNGGTLTTKTLFLSSPTQLTGTGTIDTHGLVSDMDLIFDSGTGPNPTINLNSQPGQNIKLNLNLTDNTINLARCS